ncbi:TonB family protein [Salmonella enterica]
MSLYKSAGLFFILFSASFSAFSFGSSSFVKDRCIPLFLPSPEYPPRALALRLLGRVKFSYDINSLGLAENIRISEAQPKNMFELSVFHAVSKWRFDCHGVPQRGLMTTIIFDRASARIFFDLYHT